MVSILWRSSRLESAEHCLLTQTSAGHRLTGVVVLPIEGQPALIRYTVDVDGGWRSRAAELNVAVGPDERRLLLATDGGGRWHVDGSPAGRLDGCLDVDLGFTPSTNTLPIRRLGLGVGERAQLRAAWVRFPEFTVEPLDQTYERVSGGLWRYRSGTFAADLEVDASGVVSRYGEVWTAIARG